MRVDQVNLLTVVFLAVNERHEKLARITRKHVLENAGVEIVFEFLVVPHHMLGITQEARIAGSRRRRSSLLYFFVSRIGEAEDHMVKSLHKLITLREQPERRVFNWDGRIKDHAAVAYEHCAGNFSLHGRDKAHGSRMQMECRSILFQFEIVYCHSFWAESDVPQLLVGRIGVWRCGGGGLRIKN